MEQIKKEKHKFNFVDAIIIIVLLIAVAAVGYIFFHRSANGGETVDIYYAVECNGVKAELANGFNPDDKLTDPLKDHTMGYIVDSFVGDQEFIGVDSDGLAVATTNPAYRSIIAVVRAEAKKSKYEYIVDDYYEIQVGKEACLSAKDLTTYGNVIAISVVNSDEEKEAFLEKAKNMLYTADVKVEDDTNE